MIANQKIAFIGGGHLTEMILDNLANKQVIPAEQLIVSDPAKDRIKHLKKRFDICVTHNNTDAIKTVIQRIVPEYSLQDSEAVI